MTRHRDPDPGFDPRLADWFEADPGDAPATVLETVLATFPSTIQRRAVRLPPRPITINRIAYLAAALVVVVIAASAAVGVGPFDSTTQSGGPSQPITATGAPSPSQTAAVTPTPDVSTLPGLILIDGDGLWLVQPDGTDLHKFQPSAPGLSLEGPDRISSGYWSIDGRQIIVVTAHRGSYIVNVDGSGLHAISDADWQNVPGGKPVFAPNHDYIFGGKSTPGSGWPSWSPDGQHMVGTSGRWEAGNYTSRMYITDVSDGTVRELSIPEELCFGEPKWSPDGALIVVTTGRPPATGGPCKGVELGRHDLYTIRPDGSGLAELTRDHDSSWGNWAPDGSRIIFNHKNGLWAMDVDGGNRRPISPALADLSGVVDEDGNMRASWQPTP
jgi:hypothetical protein